MRYGVVFACVASFVSMDTPHKLLLFLALFVLSQVALSHLAVVRLNSHLGNPGVPLIDNRVLVLRILLLVLLLPR